MTDLLTMPEVAQITRTPIETLRYWRHVGSGPPSFRLGRRVMYEASDVDRWISDKRRAECGPNLTEVP